MPDLAASGPLLVFDFDCTIIHVDGDDEVNKQWSIRSHKRQLNNNHMFNSQATL